MRSTVWMCFAASIILLMRNLSHAVRWKIADRFPELLETDLNMKANLVIE